MYKREDFYIVNYKEMNPKFRPYYVSFFKFKDEKEAEKSDLFKHVMKMIESNSIHHIFQVINAFFMFQDQYDVIEHRYLRRDKAGNVIETPEEMCERVASFVASSEPRDNVPNDDERKTGMDRMNKWYPIFLEHLLDFKISPNTPAWTSAGIPGFGSFACTVTHCGDSLESITKWYKDTAYMNRYGYGVGHTLHEFRPKGAPFGHSKSTTLSPLKWLNPIQALATCMAQGNSDRDSANMVTCPVWHPTVLEFIEYKVYPENKDIPARKLMKHIMQTDMSVDIKEALVEIVDKSIPLKNFNMSVLITDKFMEAVKNDDMWEMRFELPDHSWKKVVKEKAIIIWDKICKGAVESADPGVMFYDTINKHNPIESISGKLYCSNPCLTGDTIVAMADGKGDKTIKELAGSDKDATVYCYDDKGNVCIRTMRNPRITGHNEDVYELELDSGDRIKATKNHKFMLKDKSYKRMDELENGDSLQLMTKFESDLSHIIGKKISNKKPYVWIDGGKFKRYPEHKYIAEFFHGKVPPGHVVHHIDHDGKNNSPDNLRIMESSEHRELHASLCNSKGELNNFYNNVTNEEVIKKAIELTLKLGRKFGVLDWYEFAKENKIPVKFSKWRQDNLHGDITGLAKWAASECGYEKFVDSEIRVIKKYQELLEQGYNCEIRGNNIDVIKTCEYCNNDFSIYHHRREQPYCSRYCAGFATHKSEEVKKKQIDSYRETIKKRHNKLKVDQITSYNNLKTALKRDPLKKEWIQECKNTNISHGISHNSDAFKSYNDLKEASSTYNHKVVGVKYCGKETVYNGTVDEFHGFFIGGFQNNSLDNKSSTSYIYNLNCGEQILGDKNSCNLWTINLTKHLDYFHSKISWGKLRDSVNIAVRMADNLATVNNYPNEVPELEKNEKNQRRVGIDITGLADILFSLEQKYGSAESLKTISSIYKFLRDSAVEYSVKLGKSKGSFPSLKHSTIKWKDDNDHKKCPKCGSKYEQHNDYVLCSNCPHGEYKYLRNMELLTQAPTGTRSRVLGVSFGIEPQFGKWYKSNVMEGKVVYNVSHMLDWYLRKYCKKHDVKMEDVCSLIDDVDNKVEGKYLTKELEQILDCWLETYDVSPKQHIDVQATAQKWIDNATSKTINCPKGTTQQDVSDMYMYAWEKGCKGITVYIDGSHYKQVIGTEEKCPSCGSSDLLAIEGCVNCKNCSWSKCSV